MKRMTGVFAALVLAVSSLAACSSSDDKDDTKDEDVKAASYLTGDAKALADQGTIKIGVKIDQPGIGYKAPGADEPEGIDIEVAKILAAALGIAPSKIEFVETVSANREPYLQNGTVDLVLASYSITDQRRLVVGQAGPYYVTGQQLLIREEDADKIKGPEDLQGVPTCSVEGSTSLTRVQDTYGADPAPFATYSECVEQLKSGGVDAVTTDGAILLGYAAQDPSLKVVGKAFSQERYGVGYKLARPGMCEFINKALQEAYDDGSWADAFEDTLGKSGVDTPEPPALDPC